MKRRARHAPKSMTRVYKRTMAQSVLVHRGDLASLDVAGFARSYGLALHDAEAMVEDERNRRRLHG